VLGFLSVSTSYSTVTAATRSRFNPVLGFLSVSTTLLVFVFPFDGMFQSRAGFSECLSTSTTGCNDTHTYVFQSRAGFSECLDRSAARRSRSGDGFNPVLGFLSVSTQELSPVTSELQVFQSRAGFSECLDDKHGTLVRIRPRFNPVLGFLSVSTSHPRSGAQVPEFQSRAGFSECLDLMRTGQSAYTRTVSIPCWVF